MSTQDKLINRFKGLPKDFSFDELSKLLIGFGYEKIKEEEKEDKL
ncbi:hypothetical protein FACS1894177_08930 [Bacteroidia bacterium]|nr:hypothetical protein FACS1894177_08930 [Bacteroidia bacterium]